MTTDEAHRLAREKGVSGPLYALVRALLTPFFTVWFRLYVAGREHVPASGAAILAPNHKSFWDSFFLGIAVGRHLRFMGKVELFDDWKAPLFVRLGAFPVRRGEADGDALATARAVLDAGGLLAVFPEGTRIRAAGELGEPRRGAGRLALESGAPLVPAAITGTERLWLGPFPKPRKVQIAFAPPIPVAEIASTPEEAGRLVEQVLWPQVEDRFGQLLARPGLIAAAAAAIGVGSGVAVHRRRRARRRAIDPRRIASSGRRSRARPVARRISAQVARPRRAAAARRSQGRRRAGQAAELLRRARRR